MNTITHERGDIGETRAWIAVMRFLQFKEASDRSLAAKSRCLPKPCGDGDDSADRRNR